MDKTKEPSFEIKIDSETAMTTSSRRERLAVRRKRRFVKNKKRLILSIVSVLCVIALLFFLIRGCNKAVSNNPDSTPKTSMEDTLAQASTLSAQYNYDEALAVLDNSKYTDKKEVQTLRAQITESKNALVPYDGTFYHVFFHSLIIYPELAFDGDYKHEGYDMWMTTVSEFKAMLPQLYERGFILYPLNEVESGKEVLLPPGKKPLIISIDDVNYYNYMKGDGFADKLVINDEGNLACEVTTPDGNVITTYDGDVMPILDEFVREHPDFSYHGAKGVVAVTGYEGVFGYRTVKLEGEEKEAAKAEARKIATKLQETGWLLACHSYTHNDYFRDGGVSMEDLTYDTNRFKERISEDVFYPDIYISPFGYHLSEGDERLQYLKNMGYNIFCPVSPAMRSFTTEEGVVISERFNLDRYNMRTKTEYINKTFFDVDSVYYKG